MGDKKFQQNNKYPSFLAFYERELSIEGLRYAFGRAIEFNYFDLKMIEINLKRIKRSRDKHEKM